MFFVAMIDAIQNFASLSLSKSRSRSGFDIIMASPEAVINIIEPSDQDKLMVKVLLPEIEQELLSETTKKDLKRRTQTKHQDTSVQHLRSGR